jgi:cytochrome c biogenesis protein CcdA
VAFAFGAGLLAPVNPCGFAMLPAFLGYYLGDASKDEGASGSGLARLAQGFAVGGAVSAGFAGAFVVAALLVSVGLRSLVGYVPWAAAVIGAVLVGLGLAMAAGRHVALRPLERLRPGQERGYRRMALFGAAYALASLSCTLAVLLAVVAQALATTNPAGLAAVLVAYGAGAATVLTALSVSAALTRGALARSLRRVLPHAGRLGGLLLVASGLYLLAYWLPVLAGSPSSPLSGFGGVVSGRLTDLLDANRGALGALALGLLLGGGALAVRFRRSRGPVEAQAACCEEGAGDPRAQVLTGSDRQP